MKLQVRLLSTVAVITLSSFLMDAQIARAATISTGSTSVFASSTINAITGDFSDVPTPNDAGGGAFFGGYNPLAGYGSLQGASFSTPNAGGLVNVNSSGFYGASDLQAPYAVNSVYTGSAPDILQITLSHPVTAFALDFDSLFASTTANFTLSNGYTTSVSTPSTMGQTEFIGFTSSTPFDTITLSVPNNASWVVADFTQADAIATPLPASGTMLLAALLGIWFFMYRSKSERNSASV